VDILNALSKELNNLTSPHFSAKKYFDVNSKANRYAIGKNAETLRLHEISPLKGIIDDFAPQGSFWHDIPIVKTADVPINAIIANCSTSISPVNVKQNLIRSGHDNVIGINDLVVASNGLFQWPNFVQSMRADLLKNTSAWQRLYDSLVDEESRQTFFDIVRFRLSAEVDLMKSYRVRVQEQYLEPFMRYQHETFVDAGGFDGDTTEAFAKKYNDYLKILFFEPSRKNMLAAHRRLADFRDIQYYDKGLSDNRATLRFDPNAGSASALSVLGSETIEVDKLDQLVDQPVTFIKMDLEGWELNALKGSIRHLKDDRPKLAIAAYHDSPDFRLIFEFIENLDIGYDVFMRHYTQGWSETVLFFRPRKC
jgi:FkbM family methyltransferase